MVVKDVQFNVHTYILIHTYMQKLVNDLELSNKPQCLSTGWWEEGQCI